MARIPAAPDEREPKRNHRSLDEQGKVTKLRGGRITGIASLSILDGRISMAKKAVRRKREEESTKTKKDQKGAKPKGPLPKQKQARPGIEQKMTPRPQ